MTATWDETRRRWIFPDCGHVATKSNGKPLGRNQQTGDCRSCAAIAKRAREEERKAAADAARTARLAAAGLRSVYQQYGCGCAAGRIEIALGAPDPETIRWCPAHQRELAVRAWRPRAKAKIVAALRTAGFRCERRARPTSGSSYYSLRRVRIRISDHELPMTDERQYNHERGRSCCEYEIVLNRVLDAEELQEAIQSCLDEVST